MIDISLENNIFIQDPVDYFLQEIDVLFNTTLTSLLNDYKFGTYFERYLWSLQENTKELEDYARKVINDNCSMASELSWDIGCQYIYDNNESEKEFYYIAIVIMDGSRAVRTKGYVFHDYGKMTPIITSIPQ